jgi:hypothetical protein
MTKQQQRLAQIQRHELDHRIDWLRDHIKRFEEIRNFRPVIDAWKTELLGKLELKLRLLRGQPVSDREIKSQVDVARFFRGESQFVGRGYERRIDEVCR